MKSTTLSEDHIYSKTVLLYNDVRWTETVLEYGLQIVWFISSFWEVISILNLLFKADTWVHEAISSRRDQESVL